MIYIFNNLDTEKKQKAFLWQVNEALKANKEIWVHGDCNIYVDDQDMSVEGARTAKAKSDYRKDNCSPQCVSTMDRCVFRKGDTIPSTIEEMEKLMQAFKSGEAVEARTKLKGEKQSIGKMPEEPVKEEKQVKTKKENGTEKS